MRLFNRDEIPRDRLAFLTVHWALDHYRESWDRSVFQPFVNPPGDPGQLDFAREHRG